MTEEREMIKMQINSHLCVEEGTMKARRLFILALALLLAVALMTTALVACNPDKGEDTTGENPDAGETPSTGDAIFTEDATLAGIKAALDAAENVTYKYHGSAGDFEYDYIYRFARDCVVAEAVENYDGQERRAIYYAVLKDGVFYDVACEDGQWSVDKNLASNTDADSLPSGLFDEYVFTVPFALEEVDGKLQPKDGAGVLSLDGDSVTLTFEKKEDGVTVQTEAYSLSLVNATEVTVPADVLERINAADWSDRVYYNGTGASGEETTVYVYDDKNLPLEVTPETTINGFPVIAESELAQQSAGDVIFTEDATLAGIKAAMSTSVSYTYEYTGTFDNENEPYCRGRTFGRIFQGIRRARELGCGKSLHDLRATARNNVRRRTRLSDRKPWGDSARRERAQKRHALRGRECARVA